MDDGEYSLYEIMRDPGLSIYENFDLATNGHFYLYRYDAAEETFYRATVPAGAAAPHFAPLNPSQKVPIGGWYVVEKKSRVPFRLRIVGREKASSAA